jgi:hypothetical protein
MRLIDMKRSHFLLLTGALAFAASGPAVARATQPLPSPLSLGDVVRIAGERRDEIEAARARVRAGEARPAIVSALAEPMISPALDHKPFAMAGADVSVTIEQQIPLSGIRGHRRASALADVERLRAEATTLAGISIEEARRAMQRQHQTIMSFAEVASVHGKAGRA